MSAFASSGAAITRAAGSAPFSRPAAKADSWAQATSRHSDALDKFILISSNWL
jgi:hypothetical protein